MATKIFINLPVKDLDKSVAFFTKLGFTFNPQFTDEKATCMIISDNIFCMFLVEEYFKSYSKKEISDSKKTSEVLIAIDAASKDEVVSFVNKAVEAGGTLYAEAQDNGWMYQHSFEDLDHHQWEIVYIDESQLPG